MNSGFLARIFASVGTRKGDSNCHTLRYADDIAREAAYTTVHRRSPPSAVGVLFLASLPPPHVASLEV